MRSTRSGSSVIRVAACVHARLLEKTDRRSASDVDIYTEEGRLAARVRGLRSLRVAGGRDEALDDLLYAYQWRPQPPSEIDVSPGPTSWLIFADDGLGIPLAERLRAGGDACTLVGAGPREDLDRLVEAFVGSDTAARRGIVHLWNLDAPRPDGLDATALRAAQEAGLLSVVRLVQAWDRVASDRSARLYVVTRGAQSVGERPEPAAIAQAPVVGL
ncbi:MAG TPA: hypothetical protein VKW77_08240, partial [Acidimicrobiales bacterium]|nr:hypothetical protein [Acidimicrobiales bacterium]